MIKDNLQTIIVLAENKTGVLNRITSLIRKRQFNVETITAGHTHLKDISRITITLKGKAKIIEQLGKQLYKILEVVKVVEVSGKAINRELALVKVKTNITKRMEIMQIVKHFRGQVVDISPNSLIIQITGKEEKIDSLISVLKPFGIVELVRTGRITMLR